MSTVTNRVQARRRIPGLTTSIAVGAGGLWLGTVDRIPRVIRVDPKTLELRMVAELL